MPLRNIIRHDVPLSYYHVYARGINKEPIFLDDKDREKFLQLFERYLSVQQAVSRTGEKYPHYRDRVALLAYCLMGNHFHLFLFQQDIGDVTAFMRSLMTSYVRYFNLKYKRSGPLFESRFKASLIDNDRYLVHISRYIHLNPRNWKRFKYSSIAYYRQGDEPEWLNTQKVLDQFADRQEYVAFLYDYESHKAMLDEIAHDLADQ